MEIIISKVRCAKPRTEKQLLNDQRLKEKFIEYHHQRKQLIENEKIMDLLEESKITDAELTSLLQNGEPIEEIKPNVRLEIEKEIIKKKRGRPRLQK
jgi:hypothetical protein